MRRDTHQAIHGPYDDAKQQWMLRTGRCFPQTQTCFSGSSDDCDIVVHEGSLALMGREECSNFERDRLMEQLGQSEPRKGVCELRTRLMPLLLREIASANMLRHNCKLFVTAKIDGALSLCAHAWPALAIRTYHSQDKKILGPFYAQRLDFPSPASRGMCTRQFTNSHDVAITVIVLQYCTTSSPVDAIYVCLQATTATFSHQSPRGSTLVPYCFLHSHDHVGSFMPRQWSFCTSTRRKEPISRVDMRVNKNSNTERGGCGQMG
jgi:hypothetical protein